MANCSTDLTPQQYIDWAGAVFTTEVAIFSRIYDEHGLPEMEMLPCQDENNNNNNNNIPVMNIGSRFLPINSENTISSNAIEDGNLMVNFQNEFGHWRLYKRSTYNSMQQKKNPYTQAPITALKQYTAIIGGPPLEGGGRQKTRRHKSTAIID